ncbi:MAG: SCO family protein [Elusimicrobia bacterium]|nr:SCO family protein [Elusimicrobiota bacterium]
MNRGAAMAAVMALVLGAAWLGRRAAVKEIPSPVPLLQGGASWTIPDFALKDDRSRVVKRADLSGKPWVAAFIYADCGSQCPMMTAKMKALRQGLPEAFLVSFSVDGNDTPERLAAYKKATGADWLFLTGKSGEVEELCRTGFKLPVADGVDEAEPIIHSDKLVLVDRDGRVRGFYDPADAEHLAGLARTLKSL